MLSWMLRLCLELNKKEAENYHLRMEHHAMEKEQEREVQLETKEAECQEDEIAQMKQNANILESVKECGRLGTDVSKLQSKNKHLESDLDIVSSTQIELHLNNELNPRKEQEIQKKEPYALKRRK